MDAAAFFVFLFRSFFSLAFFAFSTKCAYECSVCIWFCFYSVSLFVSLEQPVFLKLRIDLKREQRDLRERKKNTQEQSDASTCEADKTEALVFWRSSMEKKLWREERKKEQMCAYYYEQATEHCRCTTCNYALWKSACVI